MPPEDKEDDLFENEEKYNEEENEGEIGEKGFTEEEIPTETIIINVVRSKNDLGPEVLTVHISYPDDEEGFKDVLLKDDEIIFSKEFTGESSAILLMQNLIYGHESFPVAFFDLLDEIFRLGMSYQQQKDLAHLMKVDIKKEN